MLLEPTNNNWKMFLRLENRLLLRHMTNFNDSMEWEETTTVILQELKQYTSSLIDKSYLFRLDAKSNPKHVFSIDKPKMAVKAPVPKIDFGVGTTEFDVSAGSHRDLVHDFIRQFEYNVLEHIMTNSRELVKWEKLDQVVSLYNSDEFIVLLSRFDFPEFRRKLDIPPKDLGLNSENDEHYLSDKGTIFRKLIYKG